jgi:hypothetical protein
MSYYILCSKTFVCWVSLMKRWFLMFSLCQKSSLIKGENPKTIGTFMEAILLCPSFPPLHWKTQKELKKKAKLLHKKMECIFLLQSQCHCVKEANNTINQIWTKSCILHCPIFHVYGWGFKDAVLNLFFLCQNPTYSKRKSKCSWHIHQVVLLSKSIPHCHGKPSKNKVKVLHKKVAFVNAWPNLNVILQKRLTLD